MTPSNSYLELHSPRGAFAHFALGLPGSGGGFGLQSALAASQDVFIGLRRGNQAVCLPFFANARSAEISTFLGETKRPAEFTVSTFDPEVVERTLNWATDCWEAPGISFTINTPVSGIPDPESTSTEEFKNSISPALAARLTIDNSDSSEPVQGFFAVSGLRGLRHLNAETGNELTGWVAVQGYGFACETALYPQVQAVSHWDLHSLFTPPHPLPFPLTGMGALLVDAAPGERIDVDFVLGWYQSGTATAGLHACRYSYIDHFENLTEVLRYSQKHIKNWRLQAEADDIRLRESGLNEDQQFMIAHATRGYWASSMLFIDEDHQKKSTESDLARSSGKYRWAVNEGSFVMINTFDLAVDHLFFELEEQPWVVRNLLDSYVADYSYHDKLNFPGNDTAYPGGLSFAHDQGSFNTFSPCGYSSYEVTGQPGCYSYMTQEQLINWIVSAGLYVKQVGAKDWALAKTDSFSECLESMLNRDHPDPDKRDGIMDLDSSRAGGAGEITTYDSLDPSLGQARRNLYLAVKGWAAYIALEWLFTLLGKEEKANESKKAAQRAAKSISDAFNSELGYIPAILNEDDPSPIIPAIEGLIFPYKMGLLEAVDSNGEFGSLIEKLRIHLVNSLIPGRCVFPDGGWKLSARSENSWISKVFLCQYIARKILNIEFGDDQIVQDRAHADWWRLGCAPNPAIDQIFAGKTTEKGFYYPRAITSYLWLGEGK